MFSDTLPPIRVRSFFRARGILLLSQRRENLGISGSGFFLGHGDLVELRQLMDDEKNYRKAGLLFVPSPERMDEIINVLAQRSDEVAAGSQVSVRRTNGGQAIIDVTYTKRKPGMNALLDQQTHKVSFMVERQDDRVAINVSHQERGEFKVVERILESTIAVVRGHDTDPNLTLQQVKLTSLTLEERIELFDRFFGHEYDEWRLNEVLKVSLKKDNVDDDDESILDENGAPEEATPGQLSGLTNAVLEGTGLRENDFVKQCLANSFYFSGAKLRLKHRREAKVVDLELSFRSGFAEVSIAQSGLLEDDRPQWSPFPKDDQDKINHHFHRLLGDIYRNILSERRPQAAD